MDIKSFLTENKISFTENEPMHRHCSFKTGGAADIFITAEDGQQVKAVTMFCKQNNIPLTVLGLGSNVLISDSGIDGVVLTLNGISNIKVLGDTIEVGAGAPLTAVCVEAQKAGLSGLEFAYGIPGSVGGAVFMNAGAYGGEIKDIIASATVLTEDCEIRKITADNMKLGYRTSVFKLNGDIILSAEFKLIKDDCEQIKSRMLDFMNRRRDKQPLEYPSAGSTFKRPEGYFAGALIEQSGLKGFSVGGAQVSAKHAGFVINRENATSADIKALIKEVQDRVFKDSGVKLEREIIYMGRE